MNGDTVAPFADPDALTLASTILHQIMTSEYYTLCFQLLSLHTSPEVFTLSYLLQDHQQHILHFQTTVMQSPSHHMTICS